MTEQSEQTPALPKIFVFANGGSPGFINGVAIAEDGVVLGGHLSSDERWMVHDLGVTSDWHHEQYKEHYPEGYQMEYVPNDAVPTHEGLMLAIKLNYDITAKATAEIEAEAAANGQQ